MRILATAHWASCIISNPHPTSYLCIRLCVCVCLCVSMVSFVPFLSTSAGAATFRANAALTRKHLDKIVRCCVAQCVRLVRDGTPAM